MFILRRYTKVMKMILSVSWGKPTKTTAMRFLFFNCYFPFSRRLIANEDLQKTIFGHPPVVLMVIFSLSGKICF